MLDRERRSTRARRGVRALPVAAVVALSAGGLSAGHASAAATSAVPGFAAAFQNDAHQLASAGVDGIGQPTTFAMAPGTSPAVAVLSTGGTVTAFANSSRQLAWVGSDGVIHHINININGFLVASGTSPAVAPLPGGDFMIAYQDSATHHLDRVTSSGALIATSVTMYTSSSPAITATPGGATDIVFLTPNPAGPGFSPT